MSLILPKGLPVADVLRAEGVHVCDAPSADTQPVRVLLLNLMPQKEVTELDIARMLAHPSLQVQLVLMKISGQVYKTTPQEHMERFYQDFELLASGSYDGLIITGAPVEHLPFEEVRYWPQLCRIMDWAAGHVRSTLYICWGAQAGLYHHYGIPKYGLPAKKFGVYPYAILSALPVVEGLENGFRMPTSRHTEIRGCDVSGPELQVVAGSAESGIGIVVSRDGKRVFVTGHLEYEPMTLEKEYRRDLGKGLSIAMPEHYYHEDNPGKGIDYSWEGTARRFYRNWLEGCL